MNIQARIPAALCALHNFVRKFEPDDFYDPELGGINLFIDDDNWDGVLGDGPADTQERRQADARRDTIAREMWQDYQDELRRRGLL